MKYLQVKVGIFYSQGVYAADLNMSEAIRHFLGTSFFYGKYLFKTYYFTKTANIMGLVVNESFTKKKSGN